MGFLVRQEIIQARSEQSGEPIATVCNNLYPHIPSGAMGNSCLEGCPGTVMPRVPFCVLDSILYETPT